MINEFKYGRLLKDAIFCYKQGEYANAKELLSKAFIQKPKDFMTSFWIARTATTLAEYDRARKHLSICAQLRPDLDQQLIEPWISQVDAAQGEVISAGILAEKDREIDKRLEAYTSQYNLSFKDVVIFCLPFYLGSQVLSTVLFKLISKYHLSKYGSLLILDSIQLLVLISYMRYKIMLPLHPFIQGMKMWQVLKTYMKSRKFIWYVAFCCFILYASIFGTAKPSDELAATIVQFRFNMSILDYVLYGIHSLLFVPSIDAVFYIGIVYNVIVKFTGRIWGISAFLCIFLMGFVSIVGFDSLSNSFPNWYYVIALFMINGYSSYKSLGVPILIGMVGEFFASLVLMYRYL